LFYFQTGSRQADLDNIVKPILDGLRPHILHDDDQVDRLVVQRFEPLLSLVFKAPTRTLLQAQDMDPPVLYVRIDDQPLTEVTA